MNFPNQTPQGSLYHKLRIMLGDEYIPSHIAYDRWDTYDPKSRNTKRNFSGNDPLWKWVREPEAREGQPCDTSDVSQQREP